jgi:hypothetical protein
MTDEKVPVLDPGAQGAARVRHAVAEVRRQLTELAADGLELAPAVQDLEHVEVVS